MRERERDACMHVCINIPRKIGENPLGNETDSDSERESDRERACVREGERKREREGVCERESFVSEALQGIKP